MSDKDTTTSTHPLHDRPSASEGKDQARLWLSTQQTGLSGVKENQRQHPARGNLPVFLCAMFLKRASYNLVTVSTVTLNKIRYSHGRSILFRHLAVMGKGTRISGASGPTPATVQDAVFPPETSQADPSGSDYCR
ncbi:hypothetical protein DV515_00007591 [Chloebia gouldiae]|uniref:Uncharacterized protein n=1 Tax=Chloebia gouldiae TaxID=44316 RepID=A0A3L8SI08_CHLGU|nr:hypothetical protein DV515_00007591 [Chloebia gouldiae]